MKHERCLNVILHHSGHSIKWWIFGNKKTRSDAGEEDCIFKLFSHASAQISLGVIPRARARLHGYLRLGGNFCNCSLFSGGFFLIVIVFLILLNPPSTDLSMIACKKILWNTGNCYRNSHLTWSCFIQLGPGPQQILTTHLSKRFFPSSSSELIIWSLFERKSEVSYNFF